MKKRKQFIHLNETFVLKHTKYNNMERLLIIREQLAYLLHIIKNKSMPA